MSHEDDILLDIDRALDGQRDVEIDTMLDLLFGDCNAAVVTWNDRTGWDCHDPDVRTQMMRRFQTANPRSCTTCSTFDVLAVEGDEEMGHKPGEVVQTVRECQTIERTDIREFTARSWAGDASRSLVYRAGLGHERLPEQAQWITSLMDLHYQGWQDSDLIDWRP